jgi:DNA-binding MarR family transcriptional regulator
LLSLSRDDLFEVLRSEPRVAEAMLRRLTGIVRRTTQDLAALAFLDLEGRVARRILALSRAPEPIPVKRSATKSRRITQTEIAQMVSGARQTVNRALRSLERRGYIELTDGSIVIGDEKACKSELTNDAARTERSNGSTRRENVRRGWDVTPGGRLPPRSGPVTTGGRAGGRRGRHRPAAGLI